MKQETIDLMNFVDSQLSILATYGFNEYRVFDLYDGNDPYYRPGDTEGYEFGLFGTSLDWNERVGGAYNHGSYKL